ncbi:MAG: hypothetical protein ACJ77Z_21115 [Thermoleophilaceae bacterium]
MTLRLPRIWPALLAAAALIVTLFALHAGAVRLRAQSADAPAHPRSRTYATQSSSIDAVHKAYVRWGSADVRNKAAAACEAHSVAEWAQALGTPPNSRAVARALAASVDPAFRRAAYLGCLDELGS